jgi:hypothetical protein
MSQGNATLQRASHGKKLLAVSHLCAGEHANACFVAATGWPCATCRRRSPLFLFLFFFFFFVQFLDRLFHCRVVCTFSQVYNLSFSVFV